MNYPELIRAAQDRLNTARDTLSAKLAAREEAPDDQKDALGTEIDRLLDSVEKETAELDRQKRLESLSASKALPVAAPMMLPAHGMKLPKPDPDLFIKGAVCAFDAFYTNRPVMAVAAERYKDDEIAAYMVGLTNKAAQPPATTFTPGYAAELVRQTYAAWMSQLATVSVLMRLPFRAENFDAGSPIIFPFRNESVPFPNNFEAMWRKEGDPIRIGVLSMSSKQMRPYSAGVIGHFTKELLRRSTPSIESIIREAIVEDTAMAMDAYFFSNSATVVDVRPPGIANGIDPADTHASSGTAWANVDGDLQKMVNQLLIGRRLGVRPVWVMNMINAAALGTVAWPFGALVYPGMSNLAAPSGTLKGFPVFVGNNVPVDKIYLLDAAQIAFAGGTPQWEVSDQATLHEETQTPLPIVAGAAPGTAATPVRSLFQTHSAAVKAVYELSWLALRTGAVQELTGVTWGTSGITPPVIATTPAAPGP